MCLPQMVRNEHHVGAVGRRSFGLFSWRRPQFRRTNRLRVVWSVAPVLQVLRGTVIDSCYVSGAWRKWRRLTRGNPIACSRGARFGRMLLNLGLALIVSGAARAPTATPTSGVVTPFNPVTFALALAPVALQFRSGDWRHLDRRCWLINLRRGQFPPGGQRRWAKRRVERDGRRHLSRWGGVLGMCGLCHAGEWIRLGCWLRRDWWHGLSRSSSRGPGWGLPLC